jgi:hypothetical protein
MRAKLTAMMQEMPGAFKPGRACPGEVPGSRPRAGERDAADIIHALMSPEVCPGCSPRSGQDPPNGTNNG